MLVLRAAEVDGLVVDVGVDEGVIAVIGACGTLPGANNEIECAGGALIPGLHDHHLHLLSMASAGASLDVALDLDRTLRAAHAHTPPGSALRAINYDEVGEGPLDRWRLDALAPGRPVRVQHRSGALWVLSTAALEQVGAGEAGEAGIERDERGEPTGRLFRLDGWLQERLPPSVAHNGPDADPAVASAGDLAAVGRRLASYGVTGVTDCTPTATTRYYETLAGAVKTGALPLRVTTTGGPALSAVRPPAPLHQGPVKVLLTDHALPALDDVVAWFEQAHGAGRAVAVHCVTRAALLLALAAWAEVGTNPGDRIEHASVTPPEAIATLRRLSLTVVTQPAFVAVRGDTYLAEVEAADRPDLYRCRSLLEGGVEVGGSTDAPFGPDDPWQAVQAAITRQAPSGAVVGSDRGLSPAASLGLFLGSPERPGGPSRGVRVGEVADLCLLDVPLERALADPSRRHVVATIVGGRRTYTA
jgi:predicted amidohydrolase YtcJ